MISAFHAFSDSDLILPLTGCDFSINACDLKSCSQHASQCSFNYGSSKGIIVSYRTVISALRIRETSFRPSKGPFHCGASSCEQEEFLFHTEPGFVFLGFIHDDIAKMTEIETSRSFLVRKITFAENQDGVLFADGIFAEESRL
jgi:hypothetical protein